MLIFGDNLQALKTLLEMKKAGKLRNADGTAGVRLVYIDPLFSTRRDFLGTEDQKAYQDKLAGGEFLARISDLAMVLYRQDKSPRLDFWGSDVRSHTTEGDTQWVNYKPSPFSSPSMAF